MTTTSQPLKEKLSQVYEKYPELALEQVGWRLFFERLFTITYQKDPQTIPIASDKVQSTLESIEQEINRLGSGSALPFKVSFILRDTTVSLVDKKNDYISIHVNWKLFIKDRVGDLWESNQEADDTRQQLDQLLSDVIRIYFESLIEERNHEYQKVVDGVDQSIKLPPRNAIRSEVIYSPWIGSNRNSFF